MKNKQIYKGSFMKMLVLSLAVLMLTALSVPMTASADATTGAWADDFDRYETDIDLGTTGYPSGSATSDVFASTTAGANTTIDADGGKDGTAALVLTSNTTAGNALTWGNIPTSGFAENQTVYISYDIKFTDVSNLSSTILLSGANVNSRRMVMVTGGKFGIYDPNYGSVPPASTKVDIENGQWYTVVVMVSKLNGVEVRENNIYDDEGTKVIGQRRTATNWGDSYLAYGLSIPVTTTGTTTVTVDNARLMIYTEGQAPTLSSMNIEEGAEGVVRNPSFTFVFDRLVTGAPVLMQGSTPVLAEATVVANTVIVTVPEGSLLSKGTPYTIDFSGVTSTDATPLACAELPISFTTEYASLLNDFEVTASAGSGTVTANFTLNHPNGYPNFEGYIAAALYDSEGVLKAIDVLASESVNTGVSLNKTFALTAASGDELQVMLFDVTRGVAPVASGECAVTVTP